MVQVTAQDQSTVLYRIRIKNHINVLISIKLFLVIEILYKSFVIYEDSKGLIEYCTHL